MIGLRLNNYEVVSLLGEGGMGKVYLARHTFMGRRVAIKFLRPELLRDTSIVARFLDESRATNAIQHPNIIDIIDVGLLSDGHTPYLMMEYLDGESLTGRLERQRPLPIHEAVEIACQTAGALAAAHVRQIVHRDLKPDNLHLLTDATRITNLHVKVLDFGIAKLRADTRGGAVRTQTGAIMGTPLYMSPEQCLGISANIDYRTDIYALGTILYEMLCGQPPFPGEGLGDILLKHMSEPPAPLHTRVPEIPESLDRAVLRALAKKREERFDSMDEFARAVREHDPKAAKTAQQAGRHDPSSASQALSPTFLDANATPAPVLLAPGTGPIPVPADFPPAAPAPKLAPANPNARSPSGAHTTLSSATGQLRLATKLGARGRGRHLVAAGISFVGALAVTVVIATTTLRSPTPPVATQLVPPLAAPPIPEPLPPPPQPAAPAPPQAPAETAAAPLPEDVPEPVTSRRELRHRSRGRHEVVIPVLDTRPVLAPASIPIPAVAQPPLPGAGPKGGSKW